MGLKSPVRYSVQKSSMFWDITSCIALKPTYDSEEHRLHLQGRVSRSKYQRESRWLAELRATCFHAGFFLCLFFDPEDRGDMLFRNVGWLFCIPKDITLHNRRCENLKSYTLCWGLHKASKALQSSENCDNLQVLVPLGALYCTTCYGLCANWLVFNYFSSINRTK
jgi:hypothetical protein